MFRSGRRKVGVEFSQPCNQLARRVERVGAGAHSQGSGGSGVSDSGMGTELQGIFCKGQKIKRLDPRRGRTRGRGAGVVKGSGIKEP